MASIEPRLGQLGQGQPIIRVELRHFEERTQHLDEVLKLSLDDVREFIAAVGYLLETATGEAANVKRSADITDRPSGVVTGRSTS